MDPMSRSITINGRRTSIRMERSLWLALADIALRENSRVRDLVALVDSVRGDHGLTAALRVFVVNYLRDKLPGAVEVTEIPRASRKRMPLPQSPLIHKTLNSIRSSG